MMESCNCKVVGFNFLFSLWTEKFRSVDHSKTTSLASLSHDSNCFQHFTKKNLKILWKFDFGHYWEEKLLAIRIKEKKDKRSCCPFWRLGRHVQGIILAGKMRKNLTPRRYKHRLDFRDLKKSVSSQH